MRTPCDLAGRAGAAKGVFYHRRRDATTPRRHDDESDVDCNDPRQLTISEQHHGGELRSGSPDRQLRPNRSQARYSPYCEAEQREPRDDQRDEGGDRDRFPGRSDMSHDVSSRNGHVASSLDANHIRWTKP